MARFRSVRDCSAPSRGVARAHFRKMESALALLYAVTPAIMYILLAP